MDQAKKQDLMAFLQDAIIVEKNLEILKRLNSESNVDYDPEPKLELLTEPPKPQLESKPFEPQIDAREPTTEAPAISGTSKALIVIALILVVVGLTAGKSETVLICLILAALLAIPVCSDFIKAQKIDNENSQKLSSYNAACNQKMKQWQDECSAVDQRNAEKLNTWHSECAEIQNANDSTVQEYPRLFDEWKKRNEKRHLLIQETMKKTNDLLSKLYEGSVIYSKYHTLDALASFYEYFDAGRCDDLQGTDGAYNLYEREYRQNEILWQLGKMTKSNTTDTLSNTQYVFSQQLFLIRLAFGAAKSNQEAFESCIAQINQQNASIANQHGFV